MGLGEPRRRRLRDDNKARIEFGDDDAGRERVGRQPTLPRLQVADLSLAAHAAARRRGGEAPRLRTPAFVSAPARPEPLGPRVVEVIGPSGQRVRLVPPIDARVLKAVRTGLGRSARQVGVRVYLAAEDTDTLPTSALLGEFETREARAGIPCFSSA